jgi:hypothetical protein
LFAQLVENALNSRVGCTVATTNLQRFPVADLKKQYLTQNLRR